MADGAKYQLISNDNVLSDLKAQFSLFKTRKRNSAFVYAVVLVFVAFTVFLAFAPSSSSSYFINIFTVNSTSPPTFSDESYRSHFSSVFSNLFPNSTQIPNINPSRSQNITTFQVPISNNSSSISKNSTKTQVLFNKSDNFEEKVPQINPSRSHNITTIQLPNSNNSLPISKKATKTQIPMNKSDNFEEKVPQINPSRSHNITTIQVPNSNNSLPILKNATKTQIPLQEGEKSMQNCRNETCNFEKQSNESAVIPQIAQAPETRVDSLVNCDLYDGKWVKDDSYPLYKPGSCSLIDEQFNCFLNGRPDSDYQKLKWKPKGCTLPRLNGGQMLELLRGKQLVFVGDSLNRNMWESLVCILKNSVKDQSKVYEASGRHYFRNEASYSFVFKDYNCTIEFFVSPFLVQQWEIKDEKGGVVKETLRLDLIVGDSDNFKSAEFIVFNTGHWWTHEKTSKGEDYYQEGSHVYKQLDVDEAFRRALTTWARWVDANINPNKTHVLFRGYSASHFSGGQWNSGGQCDSETEPIRNETYLTEYPGKMKVLESVIKGMKTRISYLNVTRMTDYRKDGHPSIYRKQEYTEEERRSPLIFQDCSHWCLPGVPDSWNELLFAELLRKQYMDHQQKNK